MTPSSYSTRGENPSKRRALAMSKQMGRVITSSFSWLTGGSRDANATPRYAATSTTVATARAKAEGMCAFGRGRPTARATSSESLASVIVSGPARMKCSFVASGCVAASQTPSTASSTCMW